VQKGGCGGGQMEPFFVGVSWSGSKCGFFFKRITSPHALGKRISLPNIQNGEMKLRRKKPFLEHFLSATPFPSKLLRIRQVDQKLPRGLRSLGSGERIPLSFIDLRDYTGSSPFNCVVVVR